MTIIRNHTRARLAAGDLALGLGVRQARTVDIAPIAKTCDYDWLFIDLEHGSLSLDTAAQIAVAATSAGISPIVRVPGKEHHQATRMLDCGAQGIVWPHVDSAEEAARLASFCRYPPRGHRSVAGGNPQLGFRNLPVGEATRLVNDEVLVFMMVETPQAVVAADAIAAVPGVDGILMGTNDLCAEMGIPGQFADPRVEDAYKAVIAACRRHGKFPGMGGVYEPALMQKFIGLGMRFILCGSDLSFMMAAAGSRATLLRGTAR